MFTFIPLDGCYKKYDTAVYYTLVVQKWSQSLIVCWCVAGARLPSHIPCQDEYLEKKCISEVPRKPLENISRNLDGMQTEK